MCHRSVGLVQNIVEEAGIATVSMVLKREISLGLGLPRGAYVRFPLGNPVGEPFKLEQQRTILRAALRLIETAEEPGGIVELPYRWRRM